jgi:hypothetical protein
MAARDCRGRLADARARWCLNLKVPIDLFDAMLEALEAARAERNGARVYETS